ncbi:hypothetical protein HYR54_00190 [Candidatus Acetothermia bacterium]|nr:hypothetical protein [Candidatus Acetothermia bacterium]
MRVRLAPLVVAVLVALGGITGPVWQAWADPFREARNAISDLRVLVQDFQRSANDTQRFARQASRESETGLRSLQRGQITLSRLEQLIKNADQSLIQADNARGEFSNLDDLKRQIEPLGDLAVKVVNLANQGKISNSQSTRILSILERIARQLDNIDNDLRDTDDRLLHADNALNSAIDEMENVADNVDFSNIGSTTSSSSIPIDPSDLDTPIRDLQDSVNDLKSVDRRTQRLRDRIRELDRQLSRIDTELRPKSSTDTTTNPQSESFYSIATPQSLGVERVLAMNLLGASDKSLGAAGVYLVVERVVTEKGVRLQLRKLVVGR